MASASFLANAVAAVSISFLISASTAAVSAADAVLVLVAALLVLVLVELFAVVLFPAGAPHAPSKRAAKRIKTDFFIFPPKVRWMLNVEKITNRRAPITTSALSLIFTRCV